MDTPSCRLFRLDGQTAVELGDATSLGLINQSFTAEAWIRLNAETNDDLSIFGMDSRTPGRSLHLIVRSMRPYMGFYNNDLRGRTLLVRGAWTHLAFSYDAATKEQSIYVNGVLDARSGDHAPLAGAGTVWLGRWAGGRYFIGDIAGARIWLGTSSAEDLRARMFTTQPASVAKLLGSWPREGEGVEVSASPPEGPPVWGAGAAVFGFHAPDSRVELREERQDIVNALTVEAWVRPEGQAPEIWRHPVLSDHGPATGWELRCGAYQAGFIVTVGGRHLELMAPLPSGDGWLHLAGRYDGNEMSLFINGVLIETRVVGGPLTPFPEATSIGRNGVWLDRHFTGYIAEVRLWSRALADAELLAGAMSRQVGGDGLFAHFALDRIGEGGVVPDLATGGQRTFALQVSLVRSDLPLGGSGVAEAKVQAEDPAIQALRDEAAAATRYAADLEQQLSNLMEHLSRSEQFLRERQDSTEALHAELHQLRAENERLQSSLVEQIGQSGAVPMEQFIALNGRALARAHAFLSSEGSSFSLSTVELDVAYVPGPGGLGLLLPSVDDAARLGPALSRVRLQFAHELRARRVEEAQVVVPDLRGLSELEAGARLARLGLESTVNDQALTDADNDYFEGRVALQHPLPGTSLAPGSIVNVFIGVKA